MLKKCRENSVFFNQYLAKWAMASVLLVASNSAYALTADDVLNKMNTDQQFSYVAGVIGGLAFSRFLRDKPDESGMNCIFNWYYENEKSQWLKIEAWLSRHLEKPVEPLIYVLIKKDCGE